MFIDDLDDLNVSLEATALYEPYYRRHGLRRAMQLVAPIVSPLETLALTRNSILHYLPSDESQYGIPQDDPLLLQTSRLIQVNHHTELFEPLGAPRSTRLPPGPMIRGYHRKNRKTRILRNYDMAVKNPFNVLVENYALLPHLYRYPMTFFKTYYKWANIQSTLWHRVGELGKQYDHHQYLLCHLPQQLPSLPILKRGSTGITRTTLGFFDSPESLLILEIWKWLGEERELSVLSKAGDGVHKLDLIWVESGRWTMLNLGLLDSWRRPSQKEIEAGADPKKGLIDPPLLQRRFLRFLMALQGLRVSEEPAALAGDVSVQKTTSVEPPVTTKDTTKSKQSDDAAVKVEQTKQPEVVVAQTPIQLDVPTRDGKTVTVGSSLDADKLPSDKELETDDNIRTIDEAIAKDLEALDALLREVESAEVSDTAEDPMERKPVIQTPIEYKPEAKTLEAAIIEKADLLADSGTLSAAEYRRLMALSTAFQKLPDPYGSGQSLVDAATIPPTAMKVDRALPLKQTSSLIDKSMAKSTLVDFDRKYVKEVLRKDIVNSVLNIQRAGIAVTGYEVETIETALNNYEAHTVQLAPVNGKVSTVRFHLPKVAEDGTFTGDGVRYRLRKQRADAPIRKLNNARVALTSYYSKVFVDRSEKQVHNYPGWLTNRLVLQSTNDENARVRNLMFANVFDSTVRVPRLYSILAQRFLEFELDDYKFYLDYKEREAHFGKDVVQKAERKGLVMIASQGKVPVLVDDNDMLYRLKDDVLETVGTFEQLLGLEGRGPLETIELRILGKSLPIGVVLAYYLGFKSLLQLLNVPYRTVAGNERLYLADDEFALRFEDQAFVFSRDNRVAAMVLSGFIGYEKTIRNYSSHLFDRKDIYLNVLEQNRMGLRYLRELDLMQDLFIDPITLEVLEELKEPTDFVGLLLRACELLQTDWSPDEVDMSFMRIKGYERFAGAVYSELVRSVRQQRARGAAAKVKIELQPYAVWKAVTQDSAVNVVSESNPIQNLKEQEEVTYSGTGGRGARSMVGHMRLFHENDLGVISEATKDSADVAITTFMTADPNLVSLRGVVGKLDSLEDNNARLISTSALLAPCVDRDDGKRVNFVSIQQGQGTFAKGYQVPPLRTGYEQVVASRTDDLFATTAKKPGRVSKVTDRTVVVTYDDGSIESVELGRRFGKAAGMVFPHALETPLKEGDKVAIGDVVAYNSRYFALDPLDPKVALLKGGVLVTTALLENTDTLEDSSAISERISDLMETEVTHMREITVAFDQVVHDLVTEGSDVDVDTTLCLIEDAISAQNSLFDERSLDTLRALSSNAPRAKVMGRVERVEVFYHGELDDMSASVQELAVASDRFRKRMARDLGRKYTSGQVDGGLRVGRDPLPPNHAVIRVYITSKVKAAQGDKGVFANQLKTIFGRVMRGVNRTESGRDLDALFGYQSVNNRIVLSPELMGTTNVLLKLITKRVVDAYRK